MTNNLETRLHNNNKDLYLLRLWKDHIPKYQRNQGSFAQYAREKYMKLFIDQIHIGQIGMVQMRNLFV